MAATGYSPIQIYYSTTTTAVPTAGNLASGELAINITDGILFYKDNAGSVQTLATKAGTSGTYTSITLSGGTANGVAYLNGSKVVTTGSALTFDGTSLGVGIASPVAPVHIAASSSGGKALRINGRASDNYSEIQFYDNAGSTSYVSFGAYGSAAILQTNTNIPWTFGVNGTEGMRLTSTGLGIGTSSPAYKLHTASSAATYAAGIYNSNGTDAGGGLYVETRWNTSNNYVARFMTNSGSIDVMALKGDGNVGIGTSSPSAKLNVVGSGDMSGIFESTGTSNAASAIIRSGNGTTSGLYAYARFVNNDTNAQDWRIGTYGTNNFSFVNAKAGTTPMLLDSSGNLLVGKTSDTFSTVGIVLRANGAIAATSDANEVIDINRLTNDGGIQRFFRSGTQVGSISVTTSATAYNTSSDYRLKDNQQPLTGSGAFIDALQPKTWNWKADGSRGVGFIAHEVQEVSPGSVVGEKDGEQMQAMEYGSAEFIANIIAELQSLRARVAALES